jgi:hypothetical protein
MRASSARGVSRNSENAYFNHGLLALGCPIWTEDTDFFGCGVATWTSASIDSFLSQ